MTLQDLPLLSGLADRMRHLSSRTSVIAENIANADTPGYRAKDLKAPDFRGSLEKAVGAAHTSASASVMRVTDIPHLQTSRASSGRATARETTGATSLVGNSVSVEQETMKLSQTRMEYGLASNVYRKSLDLIRLAVSTNR